MQVLLVGNAINFVAAVVILVAGWTIAGWAARGVRGGLRRIPRLDSTLRPLIASIVRYAIVILTAIAVLQRFGVETTSLIALLGAAGIAVGLALQGTLSNVAAGVMLIFLRPFRRGEKIEADKCVGVVRELGLFRTIMATEDGVLISIPNAAIFSGTIINYHRETMRRTNFSVPLDPTEDLEAAQAIILAAVESPSQNPQGTCTRRAARFFQRECHEHRRAGVGSRGGIQRHEGRFDQAGSGGAQQERRSLPAARETAPGSKRREDRQVKSCWPEPSL